MRTKLMHVIDNEMYLGKFKLSDVAKEYKTPLYVYDEENIRYKLDIFKNHFKSDKYKTKVVYATKAFLSLYLTKIIQEYDMGLDSVSLGDLYQINSYSFPMKKVVLHGNNKTKEELEYAIKNDVGYIVIDHLEEIDDIIDIASKEGRKINCLLRVNPGISAHTHEYIQTSLLSSKFGESIFDTKRIDEVINKCKESKYINLLGFHCHIGSSIQEAKYFSKATSTLLEFVNEVEERNNTKFETINLGGGFGVKYLDSDLEFDLEKMLESITKTIDKYLEEHDLGIKEVMIEPGRSVVGDSGFTLYTVGGTKHTYGGKDYVFVDGGMTDNIRPSLYQAKYTVDVCNNVESDEKIKVDIVGPCCESGDIVALDYDLNPVKKGDTLLVHTTGAYGYSMSSNYNGMLRGAVIFINKDRINMSIKREELNSLVKENVFTSSKMIFDCHSDMLYDLWTSKTKGVNNRFKSFHQNQLESSVIKGSLFTMYSPCDFDLIEACKIALKEIDLSGLPNYQVILGLEGLRNLKRVEDIDVLYNMGFRHAMVTWNEENKYATGAKASKDRGFSEEGIRLIKRMQDLDMIIDLAHLNEKSFYDALEVVNKNIIYSHGNCKKLCDHVRNVTDEQMIKLKSVDGLLGLTLAANFVSSKKEEQTLDMFIKHVKHAVSIMGIDNVCFGFDFMDYLSDFPNSNLEEVKDATLAYRIIEALEKGGFNSEEIDKICYQNFMKRYGKKVVLRG